MSGAHSATAGDDTEETAVAVTHLRHTEREHALTDPPPMADSIGTFGWLALFAIAVVAFLLVTYV
jgi:hypothetical protein